MTTQDTNDTKQNDKPDLEGVWSPGQTSTEQQGEYPPKGSMSPAPEGGAFGEQGGGQTPAENHNVEASGRDQTAAGQTSEQSQHLEQAATPGDASITEQMQEGDRQSQNKGAPGADS